MIKSKTIKYTILFIDIFILFYSSNGYAQKLTLSKNYYGIEEGLPTTDTYCIIQDHNSYIWFGTDGGVSRFNGYEFTNFTTGDGLNDNTVFHLYEDQKNRIWYMPFNNQLGYIKNDSVYSYPFNDNLSSVIKSGQWIVKIIVDKKDNIKFILKDGSIGSIDSYGHAEMLSYTEGEFDIITHSIFNNETYLYIKKGKTIKNTRLVDELGGFEYTFSGVKSQNISLYPINEESFFFIYKKQVGYKNKNILKTRRTKERPELFSIQPDSSLWVSYHEKGILVYENTERFMQGAPPFFSLLEGINVSGIFSNKRGDVWVSTEHHGVYYFTNSLVKVYQFEGDYLRNSISAFAKNDSNEIIYSNRYGEVFKIDKQGDHHLIIDGYYDIHQIIPLDNGELAIAGYLPSWDTSHVENKNGISYYMERTVLITRENDLWLLGNRKAELIRGEESIYNSLETMGQNFFYTILEDDSSQIWIGGRDGLFLFKDDQIIPYNEPFHSDENLKIRRLLQMENGIIIAATASQGIYFLKENENGFSTKYFPLKGFIVKDVFVDVDQELWFATNQGVILVTKDGLLNNEYQLFSKVNGLPSNEITTVFANNHTIYIGTNNGLAIFDKSELVKNKTPPTVRVLAIKINENQAVIDTFYNLKASENSIELFFESLSYQSLGKIKYSYMLEGADEKWQYSENRSIRYPSLIPNTYTFKLKAANEDGIWSKPQEIIFIINLPFWKEKCFFILCISLLLIISFLIHKRLKTVRTNKQTQLKKIEEQKRKIIEVELKALRAQMNPHFTFNTLNSIQYFITSFNQKKANKYISEFSLLLRKVLENSRFRTITIAEELKMLKLYLNLENLRFEDSILYEFIIDPKLDTLQKIPSMFIQPFVENSILHGLSGKTTGEKRLTIKFEQKEKSIFCVIEDTGIGRAKAAEFKSRKNLNHKSLGMQITDERLLLYNQDENSELSFQIIDLQDELGNAKGTRVEIFFAMKYSRPNTNYKLK